MLLRLIADRYQGNQSWIEFGVVSLLLAIVPWLRFRTRRKSGERIELRDAVAGSLVFVAFGVLALVQVLTHQ